MFSTLRPERGVHLPRRAKIRPGEEGNGPQVLRAGRRLRGGPGLRRLVPLDRRVALADVPDADQAQSGAGQAGPHPPGEVPVVEPAVERDLDEEEDEPEDRAAGDGGDDGPFEGLGCLVLRCRTLQY
jgi:hypothetical protein